IATVFLSLLRKFFLQKRPLTFSEKGRRVSLYQLIKYVTWVLSISFCITLLGFDVTILVAGSAALLVGLGFGLQNIFSDFISGLLMLLEGKVKIGDVMEVEQIVGRVREINLRTSVLLTRDGYNIIVPNHKFITDNLINWSHQSLERRFQINIGVSYCSDVDLVTRILIDCSLRQKELIHNDKLRSFVRFSDFGDNALLFHLMFWTNDIFSVEQVKSDLRYKIFKAFQENHISIPFPQRDIHIIKPE
ncbi:MAG: mechanosensitive ion channel, partial [Bacteroidota bacterium]|nr:mechanosensitive ion channel [Bacteroidota bacterium]